MKTPQESHRSAFEHMVAFQNEENDPETLKSILDAKAAASTKPLPRPAQLKAKVLPSMSTSPGGTKTQPKTSS